MQPPAGSPDEMVLIQLNDGNIGDHSVRGQATKTFYGYKSSGSQFLVHRSDINAQPHKFVEVSKIVKTQPARQPEPPPPPAPPYDFTQLKGVGEKIAEELRKRGIRSLRGLTVLGEERLAEIVNSEKIARNVIAQAQKELEK